MHHISFSDTNCENLREIFLQYGLTNINKLGLKTNLIADDITHVDEIKMAKDHGMQGVNVTLQGSSTVER